MIEFPPRSILVPMDLSEASTAAWKQAVWIAERFGARLEAVYVTPGASVEGGPVELAAPGLVVLDSENVIASVRALVGAKAQLRRLEGPVDEAVASWAERRGFDLIVMGTHGRSGLDRLLMGSVAEAVIRRSSV